MSRKARSNRYRIGFDLGGTKMMATVFDEGFKPLGSHRTRTREKDDTKAEDTLLRMEETIRRALDDAQAPAEQPAGIGVGFPGPLDLNRGVVLQAPNLGWKDVPLKAWLEARFHCPTTVVNDVDAGTYAEYRFGAARQARCVIGVFPGTGIGGACVYEGRLLRGAVRSCMEIGHVKVVPDGPLCGCGGRGCLEAVYSRLAIAAEAAGAVHRGEAPALAKLAGTDVGAIKSRALKKSIARGDAAIRAIVEHAAEGIGLAVGNAVNLLAPDVVVLGGGLVEAMPTLFTKGVRAALKRSAMPALARDVRVVAAELGDLAGALGAAALSVD